MLKLTGILYACVITGLFIFCNCDDITCPGIGSKYDEWLSYKTGDTLKYENASGQQILFSTKVVRSTESKTLECNSNSFGCNCPDCPTQYILLQAVSKDSTRMLFNSLGQPIIYYNTLRIKLRTQEYSPENLDVNYQILDHSNKINIVPALTLTGTDSLLSTFSAGNKTYQNIIVHRTDTTKINYSPASKIYYVIRSYYNKEYGVIAFYDLKTQSLFYRKF